MVWDYFPLSNGNEDNGSNGRSNRKESNGS